MEEVISNESLVQKAIDQFSEGILVFDASFYVVYGNQVVLSHADKELESLKGCQISDLIQSWEPTSYTEALKKGTGIKETFNLQLGTMTGSYWVEIQPIVQYETFQGGWLKIDPEKPVPNQANEPDYDILIKAFNQTKESFIITDANKGEDGYVIRFVNPGFTALFGYQPSEVIGKTPRMFQGPKTDERVLNSIDRNLKKNQTFIGETINYRKDGSEFVLQWEIYPLKNDEGVVTHYLAVQRDVTEQRKLEEQLKESEYRFRRLIENAPVGMFIHKQGDVLYANEEAANIFGFDQASRFFGFNLFDFVRKDYLEIAHERVNQLEQGYDVEPVEEVFVTNDGKEIDGEIVGIPITYQGKNAVQAIVIDITQRKRAERELKESEQLFRMIAENSRDLIALHDLDANFTYASPSVEQLVGVKPESIIGASPYDYIHPQDHNYLASIHEGLLQGQETKKARYRIMHSEGQYIWVEAHVFPVLNEEGHIIQFQSISRDVTEEQNLRELLEETQDIATIGGWSFSLAKNEFFFSKKVHELYGLGLNEEITQEKAISFYDPHHQPLIRKAYDDLVTHGKSFDLELKFWNAQGQMLWVRAIGKPFYEGNHFYKVGGSLQDVTEKRLAIERLRESEETFRTFTEQSLVGVYMYQEGQMQYANPKVAEITGYPLDEIKGKSPFEIAHPEDQQKMQEKINARESGVSEGEHYEFRFYTKQGELRHAELFGSRITYHGKPAIIGTILDITERKKAQEDLIEKQHFIEEITRNSPNAITVTDYNEMKYVYSNDRVKDLIGYTIDQINKFENLVGDLLHPEDASLVKENYETNLKLKDGEVNHVEFRAKTKDGQYKWFLSSDTPFKRDENGNVIQIMGTIQDIDERKKTEQQLKENQYFIEKVVTSSPNLIHVYDYQLNQFVYVSQRLENGLGYSREEIDQMENGIADLFHPDDLEKVYQASQKNQTLKDGEVNEVEFRMKTKWGNWKWMMVQDTPFKRDENGSIKQVLSSVLDVTEKKNVEFELIEQRKFIESVTEQSPSTIHIYDYRQEQMIYYNRRIIDNLGYNEEEIKTIEQNLRSICHPDDIDAIKQHHRENLQLADNEVNTLEYRIKHKNGHWVWLLNKDIVFSRDEEGNVTQVLGVVEDTTEQKQMYESLKLNEALFRQLFQNAPVGIVRLDEEYNVQSCNEGFCEIFKYDKREVEGNKINNLIVPEEYQEEATAISKNTMDGKTRHVESVRVDQAGNLIPVLIYGVPVFLEGKTISIFGIYVDISERKQAEEDLKKHSNELLRSNAELEQFAYVTSHNLRAPVVNLESLLEFFDTSELKNENNKFVFNKITKSVDQLNETLNDLVDIVAKKKEVSQPKEKIEFEKLFNKAKDYSENQLNETNAIVKADFSKAPEIYYLKSFMESIMHNLLSNAIKYRSPKRQPHIMFETVRSNGYVCLTVTDNGLGIDLKQHKDQVFNLYKRFHLNKSGKGMGLYLIKSQVESLGGKVEIDSQVDQGTTFYLYLKDFYNESEEA